MSYSINYKNYPPVIHYMDKEYLGGTLYANNGTVTISEDDYEALPTSEKMNGTVYIVEADPTAYTFYPSLDGTCVVRINNNTEQRLWFFCGFDMGIYGEVAPPSELSAYVPDDLRYSYNYPQYPEEPGHDGWVGFYGGNVRGWIEDLSVLAGGVKWGIIDLDTETVQQSNIYVDPYAVLLPTFYYMGTKYSANN